MTEKDKLQEEIRLLNLKVGEIKSQNEHYLVETGELESKKSAFEKEVEAISEENSLLTEIRRSLTSEVEEVKIKLAEKKRLLTRAEEEASELGARSASLREDNLKKETRLKELLVLVEELETKVSDSEKKIEIKFASLKGFEEQLLIKESLLNRREELLDLKEKGVKVK